jgi:tRNA A-37 threonylcarbamoyl transferase component Bud32
MSMTVAGPAVRWHMSAPMRDQLLGRDGLPLAEWLRAGIATIVKDAPHRAVCRVRLPGLDCHIKHYQMVGLRGRMREMLRPLKARREFSIAADLKARGIPTPDPIAWGVGTGGVGPAPGWLITATVPDAVPLLSFIETTLPTLPATDCVRIRLRLAPVIGTFLARLHAAGVVHRDLHPGNMLCRIDADGQPLLWLIDLHAVALGPPCPWETRRTNLIEFNRYFQMRASRADRSRFWQAYRAAAGDSISPPPRIAAVELECLTQQSNLEFWRSRDARSLRNNRYYQRITTPAVRGFAVRDLDPFLLKTLAADPDAPFHDPDSRILKDSRSSTVAEINLTAEGTTRRVIYKRFRVTQRRDPWLGLLRRTAATRSWVSGHGLRERCLPTARPLAMFHQFRGGRPCEGYLLTEKIEHAVDLLEFARRLTALPIAQRTAELRNRIDVLARLIRELHGRGLTHRDLKAANVLTAEAIGDVRFWFIDLVGVRRPWHVGRASKMRDLMRLNVSFLSHPLVTRTEKLRFLRAYLRIGLTGAGGWKERWRAIAAATKNKIARNATAGRPLG